jgi:minimal PKS acyl carrier protein
MTMFTLTDLRSVLEQNGGQLDDNDGDMADAEFAELGCDSITILEVATTIERRFGFVIATDDLYSLTTPRAFTDFVNGLLSESAL